MSATENTIALLEPVVDELGQLTGSLGEAATISLAISMKRIADALTPNADPTRWNMFDLVDQIGRRP